VKFVVDAQLPPALAAWLRNKGHEAVAVREIGLREADDRVIWALADQSEMIVVTKDLDFVRMAAAGEGPRVLWVRTGNLVNRVLLGRFDSAWLRLCEHLASEIRVIELW